MHMEQVESILGAKASGSPPVAWDGGRQRYNPRMAAVEYAIEHDDGQSMRALERLT